MLAYHPYVMYHLHMCTPITTGEHGPEHLRQQQQRRPGVRPLLCVQLSRRPGRLLVRLLLNNEGPLSMSKNAETSIIILLLRTHLQKIYSTKII